jgi:FkbM family methyltransferase
MIVIQIGCATGDDHVYSFVKNNDKINKIILIDINKKALDICKKLYEDTTSLSVESFNLAIIPKDRMEENELIEIFIPNRNQAHEHTSCIQQHLLDHGHNKNKIYSEYVKSTDIMKLFEDLNIKKIDHLFVDTEGFDVQILNDVDFSIVDIYNLVFEYVHSDGTMSMGGPNLDKLLNKLKNNNYSFYKSSLNIICKKINK